MNAPRHHEQSEPQIQPETEYMITDVEELVNNNVSEYLEGKTFEVKITDYIPETHTIRDKMHLPIGLTRIERDVVQDVVPGPREFIGMDILFTFPLSKSNAQENPLNVKMKWSGGVAVSLALVDQRPVLLVTKGEEAEDVLYAAEPNRETMRTYLETIGLPNSFWGNDFEDLMGDVYMSQDIQLERSASHLIDLGTTIEIAHTARYKTDTENTKQLVQELCLNIDHTSEPRLSGLMLPGSTFRNMFRFERNESEDQWKYKGAYAGKLVSGEFIDRMIQEDPKLGVPGSKLLEKAFQFLSDEGVPKQERL